MTTIPIIADGNQHLKNRLGVQIHLSLYLLEDNYCTVPVVVNNSSNYRTIGKGSKLASCSNAFIEHTVNSDTLLLTQGVSTPGDPIEILCSHMTHLPQQEYDEAKKVSETYRDLFAVSSSKIGQTNIMQFDTVTDHTFSVSTPLCRIPLHQQHIVTQLLEHYKQLGLFQAIDSPYRAATVLVKKRNVAESAHVTDWHQLYVDYKIP